MMVDERGLSDPTTSESKHQHQACKLEPQHQPFKPTEPQHHTFEALEPQHLKQFGDRRDPSLYLNETLRLRGYGFRCQRQLALTSGRVECFADQACALESLGSVMANRTEHCLYNNRLCQLVRAGDAEELRQALQAGDCPNAHNKQGQTVSGSSPESCFARLVLHRPVPGARCAQTCRCCFHSTLALRRTCFRRVM